MEKIFSWQGFWICFALTSAYYITVYVLFLRKKPTPAKPVLRDFVNKQSNPSLNPNKSDGVITNSEHQGILFQDENDFLIPPQDTIEYTVYSCIDELNAFFEQSKSSKCAREEMIISLRKILRKYPAIRKSEYKDSLIKVVKTQCENICSIRLSAEDMVRVLFG